MSLPSALYQQLKKGIVVVCAAGNDGPFRNTIYNGAPWIMTVGAGTLDRSVTARMTLENGWTFEGVSYFPDSVSITDIHLYYGKGNESKATCNHLALNHKEVAGKVLSDNSTNTDVYFQVEEVKRTGAYAGIFVTDVSDLLTEDFTIPIMILPTATGYYIKGYTTKMNTTKVKSLTFVHTNLGTKPAPQVADFSSRGPDPISPGVLKPDILAPGVDVLAAVAPNRPVAGVGNYDLVAEYAIKSGTSMAAPHVAGVAALLKAVHCDRSPAAIRSAIMTTAYTLSNTQTTIKDQFNGLLATPLDFGAGHINPNKAMNPGLVYDMHTQDYIQYLCTLGYNEVQMSAIIRRSRWGCTQLPTDLNYPSFMAIFNGTNIATPRAKSFSRTVTNVGGDTATYHAYFEVPSGMRIAVEPTTLTFTKKHQKQHFVLSIEVDNDAPGVIYGYLRWVHDQGKHIVSSPVVVINN
ncbi:hypothetical protein ACLB2K_073129 [Fragaria x ananassa]